MLTVQCTRTERARGHWCVCVCVCVWLGDVCVSCGHPMHIWIAFLPRKTPRQVSEPHAHTTPEQLIWTPTSRVLCRNAGAPKNILNHVRRCSGTKIEKVHPYMQKVQSVEEKKRTFQKKNVRAHMQRSTKAKTTDLPRSPPHRAYCTFESPCRTLSTTQTLALIDAHGPQANFLRTPQAHCYSLCVRISRNQISNQKSERAPALFLFSFTQFS